MSEPRSLKLQQQKQQLALSKIKKIDSLIRGMMSDFDAIKHNMPETPNVDTDAVLNQLRWSLVNFRLLVPHLEHFHKHPHTPEPEIAFPEEGEADVNITYVSPSTPPPRPLQHLITQDEFDFVEEFF